MSTRNQISSGCIEFAVFKSDYVNLIIFSSNSIAIMVCSHWILCNSYALLFPGKFKKTIYLILGLFSFLWNMQIWMGKVVVSWIIEAGWTRH